MYFNVDCCPNVPCLILWLWSALFVQLKEKCLRIPPNVLSWILVCRYTEAIREFSKILLYIFKTKQYHQKSPQYEQILKKNEQMYALLAISLSICPRVQLVEETVNSQLREKYGEKMMRMHRYDDEAFALYDELFSYACPKFITPSSPSYDEPPVNYNQVRMRVYYRNTLEV